MDTRKDALKATGIVGGAQIISILIRIVRTKIIAVLLGPTGIGILGLFQSTLEIVQSATGLGLGFSAVRDVAEATGTKDQQKIGRTITILRRWVWLTGLLGMAVLIIFRDRFSQYAFKDAKHSLEFLLLAVVPLLAALSGGQMALLRGIRRIGDMALAGVLGTAAGLCITVPLYWILGIKGIVPAMILTSLTELGLSWHFSRRVRILSSSISMNDTIKGGAGMIRLGLFTVFTGLATAGTLYLIRIFISEKLGVNGVGQFQAAWNLSATYVGLVLGAMGADYFPRLSAVNHNNKQVCQLVNEQTEIALLLAGPIIIGMICFMDMIVALFYTSNFDQSVDILLWQMPGNLLKVLSWPIGFVLLAKNRGKWFIFTELLWNLLFWGTIRLFWNRQGIGSAGIGFTFGYFILLIVIFFICRHLCNFSWSINNWRIIFSFSTLTVISFLNVKLHFLPFWRLISFFLLMLSIAYSCYELQKIINLKIILEKFRAKLGLPKVNQHGK